jgi:hypothetical protein
MTFSATRTIAERKNIVYFVVFECLKGVLSRSKSFEIALDSVYTHANRCKSFVLHPERLCFVTILINNALQNSSNGFATVFQSVIFCYPVLCSDLTKPFAVRLSVKQPLQYFKPRFNLKTRL